LGLTGGNFATAKNILIIFDGLASSRANLLDDRLVSKRLLGFCEPHFLNPCRTKHGKQWGEPAFIEKKDRI
jgi:hypothetical protein